MTDRRDEPSLWLPASFLARAQRAPDPAETGMFWAITVGFEDLLGAKSNWDGIRDRLRRYSLTQILDILGRISAVVQHYGPWRREEGQLRLLTSLFYSKRTDVLSRLVRVKKERATSPETSVVLFHDLQLVNLAKVALLEITPSAPAGLMDDGWLEPLAEALLMVTDLVTPLPFGSPEGGTATAETTQRVLEYMLANALFHSADAFAHGIGRAHSLYLTDRPSLRECGCYVDLPALAERVTGLKPRGLWTAILGCLVPWYMVEIPDGVRQPIFIRKSSFFASNYRFEPAEIERVFRLIGRDIEELRAEVKSLYSIERIRPYHVLPFARWPLTFVGDDGFCLSVKFLMDKAMRGIHHVLIDPDRTDRADRDRFLTYMGVVFEEYVEQLFRRVFPREAHRFLGEQDLSAVMDGKRCDGILDYGDAVVLIETKATLFPLAVWAAEGRTEFESKCDDIFRDGAEQIDAMVQAIQSGRLRGIGLDSSRIQKYYPVIVTLEELGLHPLMYTRIAEVARAGGLLAHPKIRPLQVMDVGDVEFLEIALARGRSFRDLLDDKLASPLGIGAAFGNHWILRGEGFVKGSLNAYLLEQFHEAAGQSLEFLREHRH